MNPNFIIILVGFIFLFYAAIYIIAGTNIAYSKHWFTKLANSLIILSITIAIFSSIFVIIKMGIPGLIAVTGIGFLTYIIILIISWVNTIYSKDAIKVKNIFTLIISLIMVFVIIVTYIYQLNKETPVKQLNNKTP
jgi:hypothetical protein